MTTPWTIYFVVAVPVGGVLTSIVLREIWRDTFGRTSTWKPKPEAIDYVMMVFMSAIVLSVAGIIVATPYAVAQDEQEPSIPENCARVVVGHHTETVMIPISNGKTTAMMPSTRDVAEYEIVCATPRSGQ